MASIKLAAVVKFLPPFPVGSGGLFCDVSGAKAFSKSVALLSFGDCLFWSISTCRAYNCFLYAACASSRDLCDSFIGLMSPSITCCFINCFKPFS